MKRDDGLTIIVRGPLAWGRGVTIKEALNNCKKSLHNEWSGKKVSFEFFLVEEGVGIESAFGGFTYKMRPDGTKPCIHLIEATEHFVR